MKGSTGGGDSSGMGIMERRLERERRRSGRLKDGRWRMGTKETSSSVGSAEQLLCEANEEGEAGVDAERLLCEANEEGEADKDSVLRAASRADWSWR